MTRYFSLFLAGLVLLSGCRLLHDSADAPVVMTPELRAALKVAYGGQDPGDEAIRHRGGPARSIDAKLRQVGAKLAPDGKMFDRNGKEIYLWSDGPGVGMRISDEEVGQRWEARRRAIEDARRHYTVIDVGYWGARAP